MRRVGGCMVLTFDDFEAFDTWWSSVRIGADAEVRLV